MFGLNLYHSFIIVCSLISAAFFEFMNGIHGTANTIATVIYTKSLSLYLAVFWSEIWNSIGVFMDDINVSIGILNILSTDIINVHPISQLITLILFIILTAIILTLNTRCHGIPYSSSHKLIDSIFCIGLGYLILAISEIIAINWLKVKDIGLSSFFQPFIGFSLVLIMLKLLKYFFYNKYEIFKHNPHRKHSPIRICSLPIFTCTSVNFSYGSNYGQKNIGLVMFILIVLLPIHFAINHPKNPQDFLSHISRTEIAFKNADFCYYCDTDLAAQNIIFKKLDNLKMILQDQKKIDSFKKKESLTIKKEKLTLINESKKQISVNNDHSILLKENEIKTAKTEIVAIKNYIKYAPSWVILLITISLGIVTIIGWNRNVIMVRGKFDKTPFTNAQNKSAKLVMASTILLSPQMGLPFSTTHVFSSSITGAMVAEDKLKDLKNYNKVWILTLPITLVIFVSLLVLLCFITK